MKLLPLMLKEALKVQQAIWVSSKEEEVLRCQVTVLLQRMELLLALWSMFW